MRIIADFHIHSPYSRAVSKEMTLENLDHWARLKGITVMGTGDFTHPAWIKEIKTKLEPVEAGLYQLKNSYRGSTPINPLTKDQPMTRFILTVEISSIYSKGGKTRRVHSLIFAPSVETAEKINAVLGARGNIKSDGRPILGLGAKELAKIVFDIDSKVAVVPAHCVLPDEQIHTRDGMKPIKEIQKGNEIYTHKGRLRRVEDVYTRSYQGMTYHIQPWYFRPGITTTPEHPFFAIKTQKHCAWQHGFCRPGCAGESHCCKRHIASEENFQPQWIQAKDLEKGDVLMFPRPQETKDVDSLLLSSYVAELPGAIFGSDLGNAYTQTVTMRGTRSRVLIDRIPMNKEFCRLAGYFVAEGSVNGRDAISFAFATHEKEYVQDVKLLMEMLFGVPCAHERVKGNGIELIFYSKIIQRTFSSLFYRDAAIHRAHTKALPMQMMTLPPEKQVEIFRGWWRGDTGYTVSRELMNQMKTIALRLGIIPSITIASAEDFNRKDHAIDGRIIYARHDLFHFSSIAFFEDAFGLREDAIFQKHRFLPKLSRRHGWMDASYIYMPIRDIKTKEYEGMVYNLEVEEDHSYLAEFAAVHNCWTPWFSVFGSMSGFDTLEECYDEYAKYIFAIETGLSSDPAMNRRLSKLDNIALISNSDSHSLQRIGREANVFETELSYDGLMSAIKAHDPKKFLFTVEFFPEEGKYHYDGHRNCDFSCGPEETKRLKKICPKCGKPMTVGVMYRVDELADRPAGGAPPAGMIPFKSMVPLDEIIAEAFGVGTASKRVKEEYQNIIAKLGSEFSIVIDASRSDLASATTPEIVEGIMRVREGRLYIEPGYDGEYGHVRIFGEGEPIISSSQAPLF